MKKNSNISFKNTKIMVLKIYYYYLKNFIMKIANKGEFQEIAFNHSSDINFKVFTKLYKKCTAKLYFFY